MRDDPPCKKCGHPRSHHNSHGHDSGGCTTCEQYDCLDYVHDHDAKKPCPTCGDEGLIRSVQSGCHVPCPTCRVSNAAAHAERFHPETITDEEATLVRHMNSTERAYLCGRLVEREGSNAPEDRAVLFEQMRRIVSERRYGSPYSVSEIRAFVTKHKRACASPRETYLLHAANWLCRQVHRLTDRATELETAQNAAISELPDDPPGGYTFPGAVRAMRQRIDTLESALKFYADHKNYRGDPQAQSRVEADLGGVARDALLNPRKQ